MSSLFSSYLESSETLLRPQLRLPVTLVAEGDVFTKPPRSPSIRPETPSVRSFMNLIGLPKKSVEPAWDNPVVLGNYGAQEGRFLFISFISQESLFDFWTLSLTWLRQIFKQKFGKLFDQNPPPPQKFANFFSFFYKETFYYYADIINWRNNFEGYNLESPWKKN